MVSCIQSSNIFKLLKINLYTKFFVISCSFYFILFNAWCILPCLNKDDDDDDDDDSVHVIGGGGGGGGWGGPAKGCTHHCKNKCCIYHQQCVWCCVVFWRNCIMVMQNYVLFTFWAVKKLSAHSTYLWLGFLYIFGFIYG